MSAAVIVGIDGSAPSRRTVEFATNLAESQGVGLVVAHVIPWSPYSFNTPSENEERGERKQQELRAATTQIIEPAVEVASGRSCEVTPGGLPRHEHQARRVHPGREVPQGERGRHGLGRSDVLPARRSRRARAQGPRQGAARRLRRPLHPRLARPRHQVDRPGHGEDRALHGRPLPAGLPGRHPGEPREGPRCLR